MYSGSSDACFSLRHFLCEAGKVNISVAIPNWCSEIAVGMFLC